MHSLRSTALLGLKLARAGRVRIMLSVLLVGISMTVFLIVTSLGRIGSSGLDDAIDADSGALGTYAVETQESFGLGQSGFVTSVDGALSALASAPLAFVLGYPDVEPECPPFDVMGADIVRFVHRSDGSPYPVPYGQGLPADTKICLAGVAVPSDAIYLSPPGEVNPWGSGLIISPTYEPAAALMTPQRIVYRFVVTTGDNDSIPAIRTALDETFGDIALRSGVTLDDTTFNVSRIDKSDKVRAASRGVDTIFGAVGLGVLTLGALGLLVSQIIVVRDRMWLYGLSMALGAKRIHIALLVATDTLVTVVLGLATCLVLVWTTQPLTNSISQSTFQVDAQLLDASVIPRLAVGAVVTLLVASVWPVLRACRQDPLDVLEPKNM